MRSILQILPFLEKTWLLLLSFILIFGCGKSIPPEIEVEMASLPNQLDYNYHIKPILSDRCFACHGPDENKREANLRLDIAESAYESLSSGAGRAIVPGKPARSLMFHRITANDPEELMPPPESNLFLSNQEIAILTKWIEQGAVYKPHWAFMKPEKPEPPKVENVDWIQNPIDQFIIQKLESQSVSPSEKAQKEILIRRVYFDLTGLPPEPEEIDQFLQNDDPNAFSQLVDRLLESPHYGERMAAHWLDVARFSDSEGYLDDYHHAMWPYRDWVIKAFNDNLSYDQFILWQIGGDQIPEATQEQILATAFNRNHKHNSEGGIIPEEFRVEYVVDRTNTLGEAFMGLTLECARCHDHKYDPISQKNYYELYAFFNSVIERGDGIFGANALEREKKVPNEYSMNPGPVLPLTTPEVDSIRQYLLEKIEQKYDSLNEIKLTASPSFQKWKEKNPSADVLEKAIQEKMTVYLPFDEEKENTTPNLADDSRPGKLWRLKLVDGKIGKALESQADGSLKMDGEKVIFERTEPFAISFWMYRPKDFEEAHVVFNGNYRIQGYRGWDVILENNYLAFRINHAHPYQSLHLRMADSIPLNTWVHITCSYDGSSKAKGVTIFQNGEKAASDIVYDHLYRSIIPLPTNAQTVYSSYSGFHIGNRHYDQDFSGGLLDEFKAFKGEIGSLEAKYLFDPELGKTEFEKENASGNSLAIKEFYHLNYDPDFGEAFAKLKNLRDRELITIDTVREIQVMEDLQQSRPTYILERGNYEQYGEQVERNTPNHIFPFPEDLPRNRYGLGQWLIHPDHPLTARVAVNQLWQIVFGTGLVETSEDFGNQGALPTHPELLEWLAVEFVESGWDVKKIIRLMMNSATYQQSSVVRPEIAEIDPENKLLWRSPRYRRSAEMVRDNALAVSGLLEKRIGGRSVFPYQPDGLWREISNKFYFKEYEIDPENGLYRRSIYTFWKRNLPPPSMIIFDANRRNECNVRRRQTNTPLQALVMLNDPQIIEACRVLATKMMKQEPAPEKAVVLTFRKLTGRTPSLAEKSILLEQYQTEKAHFQNDPQTTQEYLSTGFYPQEVSMRPEEKSSLAALAVVSHTIMNSTEGYYKN